MAESEHEPLALSDDMRFQKRTWAVQRAGWIGMALVLVAAFAGLFSNGPASWTVAENIDGVVSVHHQRFLRAGATTQMQIHAAPEAVQDRRLVLTLDPAFLKAFTIEALQPEPAHSRSGAAGLALEFTGEDSSSTVWMTIRSEQIGFARHQVTAAGAAPVSFWQFAFP